MNYADANGATHRDRVKFRTLGLRCDRSEQPVVRHLPDDPGRFALSWAVDARTGRVLALALLAFGAIFIVAMCAFHGARMVRRLALARRLAARSDELVLKVVKVEPVMGRWRQTGNEYHFEARAADGRHLSGTEEAKLKRPPLFGDPSGRTLVALVDPDDPARPLVLLQDFHPFDLPPAEQAAVRAAVAARSAG